jgi:hypothetical protein
VELDTWEQRYLVSTSEGIQAFDVPLVGRLATGDVIEMHVDVVGKEQPVTIRKDRGNIFFTAGGSEGGFGRIARIRVKRLDPVTRKGFWRDATTATSAFGASVLRGDL